MRDNELTKERDRELYLIYLRGLREQNFRDMHEAADWVRSQPASKFYISSKALVNYICAIRNGNIPPRMHLWNERKVKMLYRMYGEYMEKNPDCRLPREQVCEILVEEPAPIFFIGHESCINAIRRERHRHLKELGSI